MEDLKEGVTVYSINPVHPEHINKHVISFKYIKKEEVAKIMPWEKDPGRFIRKYKKTFLDYIKKDRLYIEKNKVNKHGKDKHDRIGTLEIGL